MTSTAREVSPESRLPGFLLVSLVLHGLWLAMPLSAPAPAASPGRPAPLAAHLAAPIHRTQTAAALPGGKPAAMRARPLLPAKLKSVAEAGQIAAPEASAVTTIDLGATFASARAYGREPPQGSPPRMTLTLESTIARAIRQDEAIETRGAAGEYVLRQGRSRCVTPLQVPHFLEGKTMLTQCDVGKG